MNIIAWQYRNEERRLIEEAHRLGRLATRIEAERIVLRGPMLAVRAADGPEVWVGGRADEFRAQLDELEARVVGGHGASSPGALLTASQQRIAARIDRLHDLAQQAGRAARAAEAVGP